MAPGTDYVDLITKAVARRFSDVSFKVLLRSDSLLCSYQWSNGSFV
jgi:hypothetical protein